MVRLSTLFTLSLAAAVDARHLPQHQQPLARGRSAIDGKREGSELVAAKAVEAKPPGLLKLAYGACGLATTGAWANIVRTTIRSNQPLGAMMPSVQHRIFASTSALSAVPLFVSVFATLYSASDSWEELGSNTCRRLNLALAAAGLGSALWVGFAPIITQIPGSNPLASHQAYKGATRAALIGAYGATAALSAAVWARSLPEDVRSKPFTWPGRVADGVCKSLVTLAPANSDNPVHVKYALLSTSFLVLTATALGTFPLAVVPSWTGRRLSRAFSAWTLLAAVTSLNLKEAAESGRLLADSTYANLSNGLKGVGAVYLSAKVGAVFFDPSFPVHYGIVKMVPFAQAAAAAAFGLTLRSDKP